MIEKYSIICFMSEDSDFLFSAMTERFGVVRRARGYFLYTKKNVRLTDLYLQGGRAILGWGYGGAIGVFKNVLERKLLGNFDSEFSVQNGEKPSRLSRALSDFFETPRRAFAFSKPDGVDAVSFLKNSFGINAVLYRPWLDSVEDVSRSNAIVFVPPFSFGDGFFLLALSPQDGSAVRSSFKIPAPLCAALIRAIYDLKKELPNRSEKDWFLYDTVLTKYWNRRGAYLFPKVSKEKWRDFLLHCLDCHIVISPNINEPSIVPFGVDAGNFSLLKKNPFDF